MAEVVSEINNSFGNITLTDRTSSDDAELKELIDDEIHILSIGSTGTGKSSHIKLFSGSNSIRVANRVDANSCTDKVEIYNDLKVHNRKWIDTIGAEDSRMKLTDAGTLNLAQKQIYETGANNLKIIWFVKQESKKTPALDLQAQFINKFTTKNNNIWNSVMIIVKESDDFNLAAHSVGAIAAAAIYGAKNVSIPILGYKCMDWIPNVPSFIFDLNSENRHNVGYYREKEIANLIETNLSLLKACKVFFRNQKCEKCGIISDERFCDGKCHPISIISHKYPTPVLIHTGEVKQKHLNPQSILFHDAQYIHPGQVETYHQSELGHPCSSMDHPGLIKIEEISRQYYHTNVQWVHDEKIPSKTIEIPKQFYHPSNNRIFEHYGISNKVEVYRHEYHTNSTIFLCPRCGSSNLTVIPDADLRGHNPACRECEEWFNHGMTAVHCYTCCKDRYICNLVEDCGAFYCTNCPKSVCADCKMPTSTRGCHSDVQYKEVYSCCGKESSSIGCIERCSNCNLNAKNAKGCMQECEYKFVYKCCQKEKDDIGCKRKCIASGCNRFPDERGCAFNITTKETYSCCGFNKGTTGCKSKCISCNQFTQETEGCCYRCCKNIKNSQGCKQRYSCCKSDVTSSQTGCSYSCCLDRVGASVGCKKKYSCCNSIVGVNNNNGIYHLELGCIIEWDCCFQAVHDKNKGCKLQWNCCDAIVEIINANNPLEGCFEICKLCNKEWGKSEGCTSTTECKHKFQSLNN